MFRTYWDHGIFLIGIMSMRFRINHPRTQIRTRQTGPDANNSTLYRAKQSRIPVTVLCRL